ncbi:hypothetical protein B296_00036738 [Ensete ventricosum]|uniref:Uncharacterized protein n=1 Tax=Ensete ventricosum TaxID=4639 RepID=A0A426ZCG0_ENSVE|nr:hypothetical protein B296_00036738 [Ensete ventricosum]
MERSLLLLLPSSPSPYTGRDPLSLSPPPSILFLDLLVVYASVTVRVAARRFPKRLPFVSFSCRCSRDSPARPEEPSAVSPDGRRWFLGFLLASASGLNFCGDAESVSSSRRALRSAKIPESEYTTLPNGLKYYDIKVGGGPKAVKGSRVTV